MNENEWILHLLVAINDAQSRVSYATDGAYYNEYIAKFVRKYFDYPDVTNHYNAMWLDRFLSVPTLNDSLIFYRLFPNINRIWNREEHPFAIPSETECTWRHLYTRDVAFAFMAILERFGALYGDDYDDEQLGNSARLYSLFKKHVEEKLVQSSSSGEVAPWDSLKSIIEGYRIALSSVVQTGLLPLVEEFVPELDELRARMTQLENNPRFESLWSSNMREIEKWFLEHAPAFLPFNEQYTRTSNLVLNLREPPMAYGVLDHVYKIFVRPCSRFKAYMMKARKANKPLDFNGLIAMKNPYIKAVMKSGIFQQFMILDERLPQQQQGSKESDLSTIRYILRTCCDSVRDDDFSNNSMKQSCVKFVDHLLTLYMNMRAPIYDGTNKRYEFLPISPYFYPTLPYDAMGKMLRVTKTENQPQEDAIRFGHWDALYQGGGATRLFYYHLMGFLSSIDPKKNPIGKYLVGNAALPQYRIFPHCVAYNEISVFGTFIRSLPDDDGGGDDDAFSFLDTEKINIHEESREKWMDHPCKAVISESDDTVVVVVAAVAEEPLLREPDDFIASHSQLDTPRNEPDTPYVIVEELHVFDGGQESTLVQDDEESEMNIDPVTNPFNTEESQSVLSMPIFTDNTRMPDKILFFCVSRLLTIAKKRLFIGSDVLAEYAYNLGGRDIVQLIKNGEDSWILRWREGEKEMTEPADLIPLTEAELPLYVINMVATKIVKISPTVIPLREPGDDDVIVSYPNTYTLARRLLEDRIDVELLADQFSRRIKPFKLLMNADYLETIIRTTAGNLTKPSDYISKLRAFYANYIVAPSQRLMRGEMTDDEKEEFKLDDALFTGVLSLTHDFLYRDIYWFNTKFDTSEVRESLRRGWVKRAGDAIRNRLSLIDGERFHEFQINDLLDEQKSNIVAVVQFICNLNYILSSESTEEERFILEGILAKRVYLDETSVQTLFRLQVEGEFMGPVQMATYLRENEAFFEKQRTKRAVYTQGKVVVEEPIEEWGYNNQDFSLRREVNLRTDRRIRALPKLSNTIRFDLKDREKDVRKEDRYSRACGFFDYYRSGAFIGTGAYSHIVVYQSDSKTHVPTQALSLKFAVKFQTSALEGDKGSQKTARMERDALQMIQEAYRADFLFNLPKAERFKGLHHHPALYDWSSCIFDPVVEFMKSGRISNTDEMKEKLHGAGGEKKVDILVMEYMQHMTLSDFILGNFNSEDSSAMNDVGHVSQFVSIVIQVFGYMYGLGKSLNMAHFDLKPANIGVQAYGENSSSRWNPFGSDESFERELRLKYATPVDDLYFSVPFDGYILKIFDYGLSRMDDPLSEPGLGVYSPQHDIETFMLLYLQILIADNGKKLVIPFADNDSLPDPLFYLYRNKWLVRFILFNIRSKERALADYTRYVDGQITRRSIVTEQLNRRLPRRLATLEEQEYLDKIEKDIESYTMAGKQFTFIHRVLDAILKVKNNESSLHPISSLLASHLDKDYGAWRPEDQSLRLHAQIEKCILGVYNASGWRTQAVDSEDKHEPYKRLFTYISKMKGGKHFIHKSEYDNNVDYLVAEMNDYSK